MKIKINKVNQQNFIDFVNKLKVIDSFIYFKIKNGTVEASAYLPQRDAVKHHKLALKDIFQIEQDIKTDKAYLLSTVTIHNHNVDKEVKYTLVSKDEANFKKNKISVESAIGKAILGREIGETFEVDVPAGKLKLEVKNIER